ncbi:MAG: 1-phosphofructokinase [Clostridia bacterium]|nr:1-phosphofructokinase [Clostridia bacterium]
MIITITMNPAVDKTITINEFQIDQVNRISDFRLDAAGKGINVSKVVKELGGRTKTVAFLGGATGDYIRDQLGDNKIGLVEVRTAGDTRTNIKVVDPVSKTYTDINASGAPVTEEQMELFEKKLFNFVTSQSIVVFTGSVPPGVDKSVYKDLIHRAQAIGATAVLDADGDLLKFGVQAGPKVIKPNIHELEGFCGHPLRTDQEVIEVAKSLLQNGTEMVVVSLGGDGALFVREEDVIKAHGQKVEVKGTVGAGDAMLAAICYGLHKALPFEEMIRLAIGTSAAKVTMEGTQPPNLDKIYRLTKQVKLENI